MPRDTDRVLVGAALVAALAWAIALPLSTYAAGHAGPDRATALGPALVYGVGAVVCHQRPERSLASWNASWPVCARCTGIYMGGAAAAVLGLIRLRRRASPPPPGRARVALALAVLPSVATLLYEWSTGAVPSNLTRLAAGVPIGAVAIAVIAGAAGVQQREAVR